MKRVITKEEKEIEKKENEKHLPVFMLSYNVIEILGLLAFLFVILFVIVLPDDSSVDLLSAVLIIQLIGLGYFIPFYLLPEVFFVIKYVKYRKVNIILLCVASIIYSLFYPIFKLISVFLV